MADELIQLDARRPVTRALLILLLIVTTVWSYYAFRWYLGNTLAEYFNADENNLEMAQLAQTLAPNDPLANWRLAQVLQKNYRWVKRATHSSNMNTLPAFHQTTTASGWPWEPLANVRVTM